MNPGILLLQEQKVIQAVSEFPILPKYRNFSQIATVNGQTQFTLTDYPVLSGIVSVNINGVAQDPLNGDYTIVNNILTLNPGIDLGDRVSGFYQILSPVVNANAMNFSSYFELVTTLGKTVFSLNFQPNPIIYVAVNGVVLNSTQYTTEGYLLTLNTGLAINDKLYVVGINN